MARDLLLMEFADGSKAACEHQLKDERSSGSSSFVWYERFVVYGEAGSHAARYVKVHRLRWLSCQ